MPVHLSDSTDPAATAQVDTPTVGRDLDKRVALDFMSWPRIADNEPFRFHLEAGGVVTSSGPQKFNIGIIPNPWNPSERIEHAWDVVEKLRAAGWLIVLKEMPDGFPYILEDSASDVKIHRRCVVDLTWMSTATPEDCRKRIRSRTFTIADTMPEAICRAALKARAYDR